MACGILVVPKQSMQVALVRAIGEESREGANVKSDRGEKGERRNDSIERLNNFFSLLSLVPLIITSAEKKGATRCIKTHIFTGKFRKT